MQHGIFVKLLFKKTFDRIIKSVINFLKIFNSIIVYTIRRYFKKKVNG